MSHASPRVRRAAFLALAGLAALALRPASADAWYGSQDASKMTLKLVGVDVDKKSQKLFDKPIEIMHWNWGAYRQGPNIADATLSDLSLGKWTGLDSPRLMAMATEGTKIETAILTVEARDTMTITLHDAYLSGYNTGGSGGEDRFTESLSLSFQSYEIEMEVTDKNGKRQVSRSGRIQAPKPANAGVVP